MPRVGFLIMAMPNRAVSGKPNTCLKRNERNIRDKNYKIRLELNMPEQNQSIVGVEHRTDEFLIVNFINFYAD